MNADNSLIKSTSLNRVNYVSTSKPNNENDGFEDKEAVSAVDDVKLTDWLGHRVLSKYQYSANKSASSNNNNNNNNIFKYLSNNIGYHLQSIGDIATGTYNQLNETNNDEWVYYPSNIESINGTLITCSLVQQISNDFGQSTLMSSPPSTPSKSATHQTCQYDVSKLEDKYSIIDDSSPQPNQLKVGLFVLFRNTPNVNNLSLNANNKITNFSHSLDSKLTSNFYQSINNANSNTNNANSLAANIILYRLGKIIDQKCEKNFLVEPVSTMSSSESSFKADTYNNKEVWVSIPYIRLIQTP
jgi:hypothetical protein